MPPRLNKRQMRELQELEELERARAASSGGIDKLPEEGEVELEDEVSEGEEPVQQGKGGFGALLGDDADEPDEDDDDDAAAPTPAKKSKNKKKKKKAKSATPMPGDDDAPFPSTEPSTPAPAAEADSPALSKAARKKAKKKAASGGGGKGKKDEAKEEEDDGLDEIDRALKELAMKNKGREGEEENEAQAAAGKARVDPRWAAVKESFAIDPKHLDADAELRRMFGSKVIGSASPAARPSHLHARLANNPHHAASLRRAPSYLAVPEAGWPSPAGVVGLARYDGPEAADDPAGEWYTYVHAPGYKQAQLMFLEVLQQADGNRLWDVLAAQPYHVDALMQLSEMMAQQGDQGAANSHLTRALYALSAPLPPTFTSGSFRLPYSQIENRALFLGVARRVSSLVKRGTWRTAFEWAKIGLGVGGGADPVGMLCWIDFLAPKASQQEWFFKLIPTLEAAYPEMRITHYPGLAYANALCVRNDEEEKKDGNERSTAALKSAILRFPMVATLLSNALAFDLPPSMFSCRRAQPDGSFTNNPSYLLSLLSELYVARSSPLWKDPASVAWLQKTIRETAPSLDDSSLEDVQFGEELYAQGPWEKGVAPAGIIRAAFISDIPSVRPYLPPAARSGTSYSYDPLPPQSPSATYYNDAYFASLYATSSFRQRGARVAQRAPGGGGGGNAADLAAAMRDGLARLLGMGPEGPQVDLNPELRAQLLAELEALNGGGMPGGFGDEDEEEDEEWDDEEGPEGEEGEDAEGRQEQNVNLLGRLGALFGGGGGGGGAAQ
ncbi:hypothetical protein JCM10207_005144 [Rhodosporidiobolus poonsookiae]